MTRLLIAGLRLADQQSELSLNPIRGALKRGVENEPFSSCVCLADLQYVDGLGELPGAPRAATQLAQDFPGLELGVRALAG